MKLELAFFLMVAFCASAQPAATKQVNGDRIVLNYDGIADENAKVFLAESERFTVSIEGLLHRGGPERITIIVNDLIAIPDPEPKERRVTIPANRLRGDAGGPPAIRGRGPGIVHQLTHLITQSSNTVFSGLLDEGLAVYLQEKLNSRDRALPNMGRDLHEEASRVVSQTGRFIPFYDPVAARTLNEPNCLIQDLCIQQGSFVRYLIETHGLEKFMTVFDGGTFEAAYGVTPERLEADWQAFIRAMIDRPRP